LRFFLDLSFLIVEEMLKDVNALLSVYMVSVGRINS